MSGNRLTLAKLTRPRLYGAIARERLFARLDEARATRLAICVVGPPGAGKTTLAASWLDARGIPGIWYQVDPGDADLATFFYYLGLACKPFGRKGQRPLPALTPEYLQDVPGFARRFFRELFARLPEGATLVLDNYQEVEVGQLFHQIVADAVPEVPPGIALIAISRRDPPDCYARLIANEGVALPEWDELRLTLDESEAMARQRGAVDRERIRELHAQAAGWAAGLTLLMERNRATGEEAMGRRARAGARSARPRPSSNGFWPADWELRVHSSLLIGILYSAPGHRLRSRCVTRVTEMLDEEMDVNSRLKAATFLLSYCNLASDLERGKLIVGRA